jgi:exodeoxyribonuclease III
MSTLKIATFNVNGVGTREKHLLEWLEKETPDIACLQELKAIDQKFPAKALRDIGYGAIWHGQQSWNGVAILAKGQKPIETRRGLPGDPDDTHSRYIEAAVHGIVVGCLYLPNGNPQPGPKFDYKLRWMDRLLAYAKTLYGSGVPVVLAGDYNVVPTDELDIYDPKSWRKDALLQPAPRARYRDLLAQGWTDAIRHLHPDEKIFTFWDYFRQHWPRNAGLRIDHLLLNEALAPRLTAAGVDRWVRDLEKASDHAPTWITIEADGGEVNSSAASTPRATSAPRPKAPPRSRRKGT